MGPNRAIVWVPGNQSTTSQQVNLPSQRQFVRANRLPHSRPRLVPSHMAFGASPHSRYYAGKFVLVLTTGKPRKHFIVLSLGQLASVARGDRWQDKGAGYCRMCREPLTYGERQGPA